MEAYRVRIIHADGRISVLDKSFSQTIEMILPLSREERDGFWAKAETKLPSGASVVFVKEV